MKSNITTALAAAALFLASLCTGSLQAQDASAVAKAERLIANEKATVATLCHPTATLNSVSRVSVRETSSGFRSEYEFSFTSALGNDFSTSLAFYFDNNGNFTRQITVTDTTSNPFGQPFKAADMLVDALGEELMKTETVQNDPILISLIEQADAESLCELLLWFADQ